MRVGFNLEKGSSFKVKEKVEHERKRENIHTYILVVTCSLLASGFIVD